MTKNIYSLLVGINNYHPESSPSVTSLKGCVNDINAIEAYLQERIAKDRSSEFQLVKPLKLTNELATRKAVIDGFQNYLSQADSEDIVLFYYSGHGSQEPANPEILTQKKEADNLNETLVCYDSFTPDSRNLTDKELRYLISKIARKEPHIVVILDCCHSGTGTREIPLNTRMAPEDTRPRSWDSFVFAEELLGSRGTGKKVSIPEGKHIILAACRDNQKAKEEKTETGEYRGIFSYFLLQTLQHDNGTLNYRDLIRNVNGLVSGKVNSQSPTLEAIPGDELEEKGILGSELEEQAFLGGAVPQRPPYFTLSYNKNHQSWVIDGGALHGIPQSSGGEQTILAIFGPGTDGEDLRNLDGAFAEARITRVLSQLSLVEINVGGEVLNEDFSYDAVIASLVLKKLKVKFQGDEEGVKLAVARLETASANKQPSLYVAQAEPEENGDYYLEAKNGQFWIKSAMESDLQVVPIPKNEEEAGYREEWAKLAVENLEHIARWKNTLELKTPAGSRIKANDIELEIIKVPADGSPTHGMEGSQIILEYYRRDDSWEAPEFFIRLTNQSKKTLYCNLLNLTQSYAVALPFFTQKSSIRLEPGQVEEGEYLEPCIPDELWEQGVTELQDRLKLIVCSEDFDASLLEQEAIAVTAPTRDIPPDESDPRFENSFNRLLGRHQNRDMVPSRRGRANDWLTREVMFTIIRPQGAVNLSSERNISLGYGVEVLSHPSLQAKASLSTVEETMRSIDVVLPPILWERSGVIEPLRFSRTERGVNKELSALELFDVEDYTVVTPETPLKVRVETELRSGEHLLAVGFDGEFFLPLGRKAGTGVKESSTEISLERLPKPTSSSRSFSGSMRIFFQKVSAQQLGLAFESYPILAVATVDDKGEVAYEQNRKIVAAKVAEAKKILLYVHGIIGDTQLMAGSGQRIMLEIKGEKKLLGDVCDLVLTFDYENLHTTIEENARLLGEKLRAVGLTPNHKKQLEIVAHSMGGLICRWFIEKEGGEKVVSRLVMAGTPNAGSPWATIQDWALTALTLSLNQVSSVFQPAEMVAKLLEFIENNDNSLDQMKPNSEFLRELGRDSKSSVPYTIIAGDRSLIPGAMEAGVLERLVQTLFVGSAARVVDLAFLGQPNDLAVTVASMTAVNKEETAKLTIFDNIACDHLTYFSSEAGLTALATALEPLATSVVNRKALPAKSKNNLLIVGLGLAVLVAIAGFIWFNFFKSKESKPPEEKVSLVQPR